MKTSKNDIFEVGKTYVDRGGDEWFCVSKSNKYAWLRLACTANSAAYCWELDGTPVSLRSEPKYSFKTPEQTVICQGEHQIKIDLVDGDIPEGRFKNDDGQSITVERRQEQDAEPEPLDAETVARRQARTEQHIANAGRGHLLGD